MILWSAMGADDSLPDDVTTLKAMLRAERAAWLAAEADAQAQILLIEKLKLTIRKLRHERFGQSSERGALLDQLELQLADLEENAAQPRPRRRSPQPTRLRCHRSSVASRRAGRCRSICRGSVYPVPATCPCCGDNRLRKLGEGVTETLELVPREWKVIQHVREKFVCRACEAITQPPAPSHPICPWTCRTEAAGSYPVRQVRPASAAQSSERCLPARRHRPRRIDAGGLGGCLRGNPDVAG